MKKALFPGDSEIDQLYKIFKVMGTPSEACWQGVTLLPDFKPAFPQWKRQNFQQIIRFHSAEEEQLLKVPQSSRNIVDFRESFVYRVCSLTTQLEERLPKNCSNPIM